MFGELDFSMIANNDEAILVTVQRIDGTRVNLTGYTITWGLFLKGVQKLAKTSVGGIQIVVSDQTAAENVGQFILNVNAADTINFETEVEYTHEFSMTDEFSNSNNPSKGDKYLTVGKAYIRRQYKAQS